MENFTVISLGAGTKWEDIEKLTGYKPITNFYDLFTEQDELGEKAIKGLYTKAFAEAKKQYRLLTELSLVLNWKMWQHYEEHNEELSQLYAKLWQKNENYALDKLKGAELRYYLHATD